MASRPPQLLRPLAVEEAAMITSRIQEFGSSPEYLRILAEAAGNVEDITDVERYFRITTLVMLDPILQTFSVGRYHEIDVSHVFVLGYMDGSDRVLGHFNTEVAFYNILGTYVDQIDELFGSVERYMEICHSYVAQIIRMGDALVATPQFHEFEQRHNAHDTIVNSSFKSCYEKIRTHNESHNVELPYIENIRSYIYRINCTMNRELHDYSILVNKMQNALASRKEMRVGKIMLAKLEAFEKAMDNMSADEQEAAIDGLRDFSIWETAAAMFEQMEKMCMIAETRLPIMIKHIDKLRKALRVLDEIHKGQYYLVAAGAFEFEILQHAWAFIHHKYSGETLANILQNMTEEFADLVNGDNIECINSRIGVIFGAIASNDESMVIVSSDVLSRELLQNKVPALLRELRESGRFSAELWAKYDDAYYDNDADVVALRNSIIEYLTTELHKESAYLSKDAIESILKSAIDVL